MSLAFARLFFVDQRYLLGRFLSVLYPVSAPVLCPALRAGLFFMLYILGSRRREVMITTAIFHSVSFSPANSSAHLSINCARTSSLAKCRRSLLHSNSFTARRTCSYGFPSAQLPFYMAMPSGIFFICLYTQQLPQAAKSLLMVLLIAAGLT